MISPWQVWMADLNINGTPELPGVRPVLIVSSELHLRAMQERAMLVSSITSENRSMLHNRVMIQSPDEKPNWVLTEQVNFISRRRLLGTSPLWRLSNEEIDFCRHAFRQTVDF